MSSCQKWYREPPCFLWHESCHHLRSSKTLPLWQAPFFWGHLRGSGYLLALQVLALPCRTSSIEVAALPSSPWRLTLWNAKRLFSCSLSGSSHPNLARETGSPRKLLEATSQGSCSCGGDLQSCWQSWGEHPTRAELCGEGWGAMLVLGVGEAGKANFRCNNIRISGEISRCVAAFLQSLMDRFRRPTAVEGNYTLVGKLLKNEKKMQGRNKKTNNFSIVF